MEIILFDNINKHGRKSKYSKTYSLNEILPIFNRDTIKKLYLLYKNNIARTNQEEIKKGSYKYDIVQIDLNKELKDLGVLSILDNIVEKYGIRDDLVIITQNIDPKINFGAIFDYFEATKKPAMLLKKANKSTTSRKMSVSINKENFITNITEHAVKQPSFVSAGVYFIPRDAIFWIKKIANTGADKNSIDIFIKRLLQKRKVRGIIIK
jgi:NDP-sugar pyrophosphorylase family protein